MGVDETGGTSARGGLWLAAREQLVEALAPAPARNVSYSPVSSDDAVDAILPLLRNTKTSMKSHRTVELPEFEQKQCSLCSGQT